MDLQVPYYDFLSLNPKESKNDIRFVCGLRTAFALPGTAYDDCDSQILFGRLLDLLLRRLELSKNDIKKLILGLGTIQQEDAARSVLTLLNFQSKVGGYSVSAQTASGLLTLLCACNDLESEAQGLYLCAGAESQADYPITYSKEARRFLVKLAKAKSPKAKLHILKYFKATMWMPKAAFLEKSETEEQKKDLVEALLLEYGIGEEQLKDYASLSLRRFKAARENNLLAADIAPFWSHAPQSLCTLLDDEPQPALEARDNFSTLSFNPFAQLRDGAAVCLIADAKSCSNLGLHSSIRIADRLSFQVEAKDILLAPAIAIGAILARNLLCAQDVLVYEIHEGSAAQMLASIQALGNERFLKDYIGSNKPLGNFDPERINSEGGSLAFGHPIAATGLRLVIQAARQMLAQEAAFALAVSASDSGLTCALLLERV